MLGMKGYAQDYISACRARVDANLRAYRKHAGKAASREFEARFFNDQVVLLDYMFVHRLTGIEGKDGNPLNEVTGQEHDLVFNFTLSSRELLVVFVLLDRRFEFVAFLFQCLATCRACNCSRRERTSLHSECKSTHRDCHKK